MAYNLNKLDDESLMERIQKNDHQAFATLVERHTDKFYGASYRIVMSQFDAEDIVQDAFLKIWNNPNIWKAGKGAKFTTWFYRIVMNLSLDKMRQYKGKNTDVLPDDLAENTKTQEQNLIQTEEEQELDSALKSLPEKQLLALNLCFYEDYTNKQASEIMGVSVKAVESYLMRAKQGVKDYLRTLETKQKEKRHG